MTTSVRLESAPMGVESQTSPSESASVLTCDGFQVDGQLSKASSLPSPSESPTCAVAPVAARADARRRSPKKTATRARINKIMVAPPTPKGRRHPKGVAVEARRECRHQAPGPRDLGPLQAATLTLVVTSRP